MSDPDKNWRTRHIDVKLGARLEQLRGERGFSRSDLARLLGLSDSAVQHVEEGDTRLTASQLWQICGITGIEVRDVFAGMPNDIFKKRSSYKALRDATDGSNHTFGKTETQALKVSFEGLGETSEAFLGADSERPDLVALAMAARRLTPDQVAVLIATAKAVRR